MRLLPTLFLVGGHSTGLSGPYDCSIYVIKGSDGLVMIDAGAGIGTEQILDNMRHEGLDPAELRWILLTHHHADHSCGAAPLRELTGCKVAISERSAHLIETGTEQEARLDLAKRMALYSDDFRWRNCPVDMRLRDGEDLSVAGLSIRAIEVRGHSPDSVCYVTQLPAFDGGPMLTCLFSGDVLQYGGIAGLINFPGSSLDDYRNGLPSLRGLGVDALLPGHGMFTITGGQSHVDRLLARFRGAYIPPSVGQSGWF